MCWEMHLYEKRFMRAAREILCWLTAVRVWIFGRGWGFLTNLCAQRAKRKFALAGVTPQNT